MARHGPATRPTIDRFIEKTILLDNGCIEWIASGNGAGYGAMTVGSRPNMRRVLAHRWSYEYFVGPIPDGLHIDHLCRNRLCVNPDHLEPVPQRVNTLRGGSPTAVNAARTHCPKGHPYDEVNTITSDGKRECRTCKQKRSRDYYERNREKIIAQSSAYYENNRAHCIERITRHRRDTKKAN